MISLKFIFKNKQAKGLFYLSLISFLLIIFLFYVCGYSNSLALTAFTYLIVFDFLSLLTGILSIWVKYQVKNASYPYGYKRFEVLAIFSCTILTILGAFFIIKEGAESIFEDKEVHTARILPAAIIGFIFHMLISLGIRNESFEYVIKSSTSSWLQEHILDISENISHYIPHLSKNPRANPFVLIGMAHIFVLLGTYFLIQMGSTYLVDTYASILMAIMMIGTMLPFALYTGKILLQTTPSHLITQLDKSLREASTLDGVLEFRDEHFWTLSFGVLAGSLHVRIRRDADEQLVLAHVWNKLAGLVQILTIHIFKDDWMRSRTHQLVYNQQNFPIPPVITMPQYNRMSAPVQTGQSASSSNPTVLPNQISTQNQNTPFNQAQLNSKINIQQFSQQFNNPSLIQKNPNSNVVDNDYVIVNP